MPRSGLIETYDSADTTHIDPAQTLGPSHSAPKTFTDVVFLTNQLTMPAEIRRLLKQKAVTGSVVHINDYPEILRRLDVIGTVIIDVENLDASQQQKLPRIIESLEMANIGTILLNSKVTTPIKSFALAGPQVKSFALASTMESVSIDELWFRLSVNLACRKRVSQIAVRSPALPMESERVHGNHLAEGLQMTGALVENLSEQLRMAGLVQRDFLPAELPNTDRIQWAATFLPAEWVSGDMYDIARIDEDHIGFYVADAVGHSMPAALLTIFLKQALVMRHTVGNKHSICEPSDVMQNLNMKVAEQKLSGYQFATACYCLLNINTLELTFARAGHPYPVLIRPGFEPRQLETQGPLLGIFEQSVYPQQTIQLEPGDKLLIYSDGAEPFIGGIDEEVGFVFSPEFSEAMQMPAVEMIDALNNIASHKKIAPSEVDDITAVALEVR
jgi:serine phosphatase RsbU (regulator of sigma subunit)